MGNLWHFGTREKMQRIGLVILIMGILSLAGWVYKNGNLIGYSDYYGWSIDFPSKSKNWFYHLFKYLIPLGLVLTWLYPLWQPVTKWIKSGK